MSEDGNEGGRLDPGHRRQRAVTERGWNAAAGRSAVPSPDTADLPTEPSLRSALAARPVTATVVDRIPDLADDPAAEPTLVTAAPAPRAPVRAGALAGAVAVRTVPSPPAARPVNGTAAMPARPGRANGSAVPPPAAAAAAPRRKPQALIVPEPEAFIVPEPQALTVPQSLPAPQALIDDGWTAPAAPSQRRERAGSPPRLASATPRESGGRNGFPRSAAERAGVPRPTDGARRVSVPVPAARVAPPRLAQVAPPAELPVERQTEAPIDAAIEPPPAQLAQGSVTTPLPPVTVPLEPPRRRRPPTVEFPTIESEVMEQSARVEPLPAPIAPPPAARTLPSIFSVIDRRRVPSSGRAPIEPEAVPEPIPYEAETAPRREAARAHAPVRAPAPRHEPVRAPAPRPRSAPVVRTSSRPKSAPIARPGSRPKRAPTFSEAEAAFFAAGEELERSDFAGFDDDPDAGGRRPTLWRRLTGRR
jgi:hypothetical protein